MFFVLHVEVDPVEVCGKFLSLQIIDYIGSPEVLWQPEQQILNPGYLTL